MIGDVESDDRQLHVLAFARQHIMNPDRPDPSPCREDHVAAWLDLSHELRTPTNAILGHIELILGGSAGPLSSEMRANLGEIQRAALNLSTKIGDVISLAESIPLKATAGPDGET